MGGARRWFGSAALLPELRESDDRIFWVAAALRVVVSLTLGTVVLLFADDPADPIIIGIAIAVFTTTPVAVVLWRRHRWFPPAFSLRDVIALSAIAAYEPEVRPMCMFFAFGVISYACITLRPARAAVIAVVGSIGMSAAAAIRHDGNWQSSALSFPIAALVIAAPAITIAASLSRARSTNRAIMQEMGLMLWESTPGATTPYYVDGDVGETRRHPPEFFLTPGNWDSLLHPEDRHVGSAMDARLRDGEPYRYRYRQRDLDGHYRWIEEIGRPIHDEQGRVAGMRGLFLEVTDQVHQGEHLARLDGLVNNLTTPVVVMALADPDDPRSFEVAYTNPASERLFGSTELVGRKAVEVVPAAFVDPADGGIAHRVARAVRESTPLTIRNIRWRDPGGGLRLVTLHFNPLVGNQVAVAVEDTTDLASAQSELERLAHLDDLTGLPRRSRLREAMLHGPAGSVIAILDLDQFKEINDAFGHECGDELLQEVAGLLGSIPLDGGLVARLGGDEFGFFIPPGAYTPDQLGHRIIEALSRPIVLPSGLTLQTSGSIGVTVKRRAEMSPDELLRQADVAMYRAKTSRSSLEVYEPADDTSAPHRMMLLGEVRRAIRNSELELHYQPIIDCLSADIVRFEALLRWRHPTLGLLPPADFIELTELSNLNADVVLHCLEIAITDAQRWSAAGYPMPISINIAGSTLHDIRLMDSILRRVERAGLPRHVLGVELTERQLLLGSGQSIRSLHRMVEAGLWMSIDDFGTGTSSLAALRQIPAHELKIDKSFVNDLRTGDGTLCGTIVAMAHQLGLSVVAEGVEDELTWRWLRAHGADHAQGFHFARPAPAAQVEPLLAGEPLPWRPTSDPVRRRTSG